MKRPYDSIALANSIIRLSHAEEKEITHLKLQKLSYISHGWCLGIYEFPFINENILAWKYGPVILSIYEEFKFYGNNHITEYGEFINSDLKVVKPIINDNALPFLKAVWNVYSRFTASQLCNLTHEPGTPWDKTVKARRTIIRNAVIKDYYKDLWNKETSR